VRVSALNSVDLPTFGRPTSATTGSMGRPWPGASGLRPKGADAPVVVDHDHGISRHDPRARDAGAAPLHPRDELAVRLVEEMDVALVVGDDDVVADDDRRGQTAPGERLLAPGLGAGATHECDDVAFRGRDIQVLAVQRQTAVARQVVR